MTDIRTWIIVDDQLDDAQAFAANFERALPLDGFAWKVMQAAEAQQYLLQGGGEGIAGLFVDVDLSSDGKMVGTGLGLAQDIRARQKNKRQNVLDYPVFRFANPDPVREYIGDDPASDDLFDLLISKVFARDNLACVVREAIAARSIYDALSGSPPANMSEFAKFCGVEPDQFELWGDVRLWQKIRLGLAETSTTHVAAGTILRTFLLPEGLLIGEDVAAVRLGVDRIKSPGWSVLLEALSTAQYEGIGSTGFQRWWARGINAYWLTLDQDEYLHQRTSAERVAKLAAATGADLVSLEPSAPFWRICALSKRRGDFKPIDTETAVTLVQRTPQEPWVDPEQAAYDVAVMMRNDPRVDPDELIRLGQ